MPEIVAQLRITGQSDAGPSAESEGSVKLLSNNTVRIGLPEALRTTLTRKADRVDNAALMYGAGAFMGIAAIGTACIVKRRDVAGYLLLALAALVALFGASVRGVARRISSDFDIELDRKDVEFSLSPDRTLNICVRSSKAYRLNLRFAPAEYDAAEASVFMTALERVKT